MGRGIQVNLSTWDFTGMFQHLGEEPGDKYNNLQGHKMQLATLPPPNTAALRLLACRVYMGGSDHRHAT